MNIPARLKEIRKSRQYTMKEVSNGIGISDKMYQAYEYGYCRTPVDILNSLSLFYGLHSIDALLGIITQNDHENPVVKAYLKASPENRKIVDYILSLKS
jgi:transcriptional regulator with XRE-family HTH domain